MCTDNTQTRKADYITTKCTGAKRAVNRVTMLSLMSLESCNCPSSRRLCRSLQGRLATLQPEVCAAPLHPPL